MPRAEEKKALWVVFRPKEKIDVDKMRDMYLGSYPHFKEMAPLSAKTWWINPEKNEWGALYIFDSLQDLEEYTASERWQKKVPEKYGCKPEIQAILDIGAILCKERVLTGEKSWLTGMSGEHEEAG